MRILRLFTAECPELKVNDISNLLKLNPNTVYHLMTFLIAEGFVEKAPKSRYRLGLRLLQLSGIITEQMEINREAAPILEGLVSELGETAYLGILEGETIAYLKKVDTTPPNFLLSNIGDRNPLFCTGTGKAILAYQKKKIIAEIVENIKPYGANSIKDPEQFIQHLKEVRKQGYAACFDEYDEGISSIGVPVWNYTGQVIAAISITGSTHCFRNFDFSFAVETLKKAGKELSEKLGYYG